MQKVNTRLKDEQIKRGLSLQKFADLCGVSRITMYNCQKNGIKTMDVANKISVALKIPVNALL